MNKELKEELSGFSGKKRRYLLMRIAGIDSTAVALETVNATKHAYNSWCTDQEFTEVHQRVPELKKEYRDDALKALRKDNQFSATMLESEIIDRLREEVEEGNYRLAKTHLGREVYSRLMAELDKAPAAPTTQVTWYDKVMQMTGRTPEELEGRELLTNGESNTEPASCTET